MDVNVKVNGLVLLIITLLVKRNWFDSFIFGCGLLGCKWLQLATSSSNEHWKNGSKLFDYSLFLLSEIISYFPPRALNSIGRKIRRGS